MPLAWGMTRDQVESSAPVFRDALTVVLATRSRCVADVKAKVEILRACFHPCRFDIEAISRSATGRALLADILLDIEALSL